MLKYFPSYKRKGFVKSSEYSFQKMLLVTYSAISKRKLVSYQKLTKEIDALFYDVNLLNSFISEMTSVVYKNKDCCVDLGVLFYDESSPYSLPCRAFFKNAKERFPIVTFSSFKIRESFVQKERNRIIKNKTEVEIALKELMSIGTRHKIKGIV